MHAGSFQHIIVCIPHALHCSEATMSISSSELLTASTTGSPTDFCCVMLLSTSVFRVAAQVMRRKLATQAQPLPTASITSSTDLLARCHGMFAASLQQMHAARNELRCLQQFVRFRASGEDVAWAASGERKLCIQSSSVSSFMYNTSLVLIVQPVTTVCCYFSM